MPATQPPTWPAAWTPGKPRGYRSSTELPGVTGRGAAGLTQPLLARGRQRVPDRHRHPSPDALGRLRDGVLPVGLALPAHDNEVTMTRFELVQSTGGAAGPQQELPP